MELLNSQFKRKFSLSTYKNLKIKLGEMSFFKDFVNDTRGDLYPLISKDENCKESAQNNRYTLEGGSLSRLFCQFFPFASYELTFTPHINGSKVGFCFELPYAKASVLACTDSLLFECNGQTERVDLSLHLRNEHTLIITCRPGAFDVYLKINEKPEHIHTFYCSEFKNSNEQSVFENSYVMLCASGSITVKEVLSCIDSGVSLADIRPIKYENGNVIYENGRIHFTASVRMHENSCQGVFSWVPGTAEISMTGALFYDSGKGKWQNFLAPVIIFDRQKKLWYVWVSSFEHDHILAYASFEGDPRFGVNVIDVSLMQKADDPSDITVFAGIRGDEDPDLLYDEENGLWLLAICRIDPDTRSYVYVFFESDDPFQNYRYIGKGYSGAETGGSFIKLQNKLFFVCGNDFSKVSQYRIYSSEGMELASFNYPDGGFRGWGSVFTLTQGSRTRTYWLTFDRHNGSDYNWSYGNIYCFELTS